jgi:transmembrane sensor
VASVAIVAPAAPSAAALPAPSASTGWRSLAQQGNNADAYASLGSAGIASAAQGASVDDLLALADVARLSGHPADAVAPLSRVVAEHASDPRTPLAAFTLGRLELDALGRPAQAATAFAQAIALGLPQTLQQDAYARLVQARARAGDMDGARAAARDYEQRFPKGDRLDDVRRWTR